MVLFITQLVGETQIAYSSTDQVRAYAPQIPANTDLTVYISGADAVINSRLRDLFVVPFTAPDAIIQLISAKLAAADCIQALYSERSTDEHKAGAQLRASATALLDRVAEDPTMLTQDLRVETGVQDELKGEIMVDLGLGPVFGMGDERTWGYD